MAAKTKPKQRQKPGPKEERLVIDEDPETVLKKLLRPKKSGKKQDSEDSGKPD